MRFSVLILSLIFSTVSFSGQKAIYGIDDRVEVYQASNFWQDKARSVATLIQNRSISFKYHKDYHQIRRSSLNESMNLCEDEAFALQSDAGACTGFLVGEDTLVTAAHCLRFSDSCQNYKWVFDFGYFSENDNIRKLPHENFYECTEVLKRFTTENSEAEYLVVKLDRKVTDRFPLSYRTSSQIGNKEKVVIIGSPSGIPLKVVENGYVRENLDPLFFLTNLDSFTGNSGSPVFNYNTGDVEGILTRGETDYIYNKQKRCYETYKCKMHECIGEAVTRITLLSEFLESL